jgi:hypothetical protein
MTEFVVSEKRQLAEQMFAPYWAERPVWAALDVGEGWLDLVTETLDALRKVYPEVKVLQVKEKFSGLRFYVERSNAEMDAIIDTAEASSYTICEICGGEGRPGARGRGWQSTRCDADAPEGWTEFTDNDEEDD